MKIGQYELVSLLGSGGMGEVWRARDPVLARDVAVKILPAAVASDAEFRARFLREARLAARLNHPHIATIYAVDEQDDTMLLAMELVEGSSLDHMIERGPMAEPDAVKIVLQVASAIGEAHAGGIVHRDIKPPNIMVAPRGVKVLDFGIAREIAPGRKALTQAGTILGTPHYMSPEQAQGRPLDGRSDIFSLGVVFYELLSAVRPFDGESATEVLVRIIAHPPPPLRGVRPALAAIIGRCLAKDPAARFQTAAELAEALRRLPPAPPPERDDSRAPTMPVPPVAPKALVADDDAVVRRIVRAALEAMGYEVEEAVDGAEAVRLLKTNIYQAMVTDLLMPRLDGWSVLDFVRAAPSRRPPKIVVASTLAQLKLSGADRAIVSGVVTKPIAVEQLRQCLGR